VFDYILFIFIILYNTTGCLTWKSLCPCSHCTSQNTG